MTTSVASSPLFKVYLAAQVKQRDRGFLSKDVTVEDMLKYRGDIHHIFPKNYLQKKGFTKGQYNQIANYVYMQQNINIRVSNTPPNIYFNEVKQQCESGDTKYSGIADWDDLTRNLSENCIPMDVFDMTSRTTGISLTREGH